MSLTVKFASLSSKEILPQVPPLTFSRWVSSRSGVSSIQNGICALGISHTCSLSILTKTSQTQRHQNMSHRMAERQSNVTQRHRTLFHLVFHVVIAQDSMSSYTVPLGPACHHCIVHRSIRSSMSSLHKTQRHSTPFHSVQRVIAGQGSVSPYTIHRCPVAVISKYG